MLYDCFTFFNELEILEIRLHELDRVVDRFVLVEATRTHSGEPKPLYYDENKRYFSRWKTKIIPIIVDDMPESDNPWTRERYQRDAIGRGLHQCSPDDTILISDVDEIPAAQRVKQLSPHYS